MSRTILITGGAGNLACQLTRLLADRAERIVLFDVAGAPVAPVAGNCTFERGDITRRADVERLLAARRPEAVIHMASLLSGSCEADRPRAWAVNMDGGFALFEAAIAHHVEKLLFLSTGATYGGRLPDPLPEDTPQWPHGLYGVTKLALERLGVYYHERFGLDFRCLRLPMVISRYAPVGAVSAYGSRVYVEAVQSGRFTFRVRPQTAVSTMYVKDALEGIVGLLEAPAESLSRRVYNVHAISPTAQDLADAVAQRVPAAQLAFDPDPEVAVLIDGWPSVIEDGSARRDWGWRPRFDLDRMSDDFIEELRRAPAVS